MRQVCVAAVEMHRINRNPPVQEITTKTAEMWSEAEKIIAENDRLKTRVEQADLDAVTTRKKYEDQIAALKLESIDKERQQDAVRAAVDFSAFFLLLRISLKFTLFALLDASGNSNGEPRSQ